ETCSSVSIKTQTSNRRLRIPVGKPGSLHWNPSNPFSLTKSMETSEISRPVHWQEFSCASNSINRPVPHPTSKTVELGGIKRKISRRKRPYFSSSTPAYSPLLNLSFQ